MPCHWVALPTMPPLPPFLLPVSFSWTNFPTPSFGIPRHFIDCWNNILVDTTLIPSFSSSPIQTRHPQGRRPPIEFEDKNIFQKNSKQRRTIRVLDFLIHVVLTIPPPYPSDSVMLKLFPKGIQSSLDISTISFNAVAATYVTSCLKKISTKEAGSDSSLVNVTAPQLESIVLNANGDLRAAINNLQVEVFFFLSFPQSFFLSFFYFFPVLTISSLTYSYVGS